MRVSESIFTKCVFATSLIEFPGSLPTQMIISLNVIVI